MGSDNLGFAKQVASRQNALVEKVHAMFVIPHENLKKTLWKNGLGLTTPVLSYPQDSLMTDFDWRVSFAEMNAASNFSEFPGYERALVVIEGQALLINGIKYTLFTPFYFPGELTIKGDLENGSITDFGVIWKRDRFDVELHVLRADTATSELGFHNVCQSDCAIETALIFVVTGKIEVKDIGFISRYDTLVFDPSHDDVKMDPSSDAVVVWVAIKRMNV